MDQTKRSSAKALSGAAIALAAAGLFVSHTVVPQEQPMKQPCIAAA